MNYSTSQSKRRLLFYTLFLAYICAGIVSILPGPTLPILAQHTGGALAGAPGGTRCYLGLSYRLAYGAGRHFPTGTTAYTYRAQAERRIATAGHSNNYCVQAGIALAHGITTGPVRGSRGGL